MSKSPREIELKLELGETDLTVLREAGPPEGYSCEAVQEVKLRSIYFDTPEDDLKKAGISLRLRNLGTKWVQTLKIGTGVSGGLSSPIEIEKPVSDDRLDLKAINDTRASRVLAAAIGDKVLGPRFETVISRLIWDLKDPEDNSRIEVALDTGHVKAGEKTAPLCEVEFELKAGSIPALLKAARTTVKSVPFRFSPSNKAGRGYRLLAGKGKGKKKALKPQKVSIDARDTTERAFQIILRSCLEQIALARVSILHSDDPEGPHRLRIALRKLRSAFSLFKPALAQGSCHALDVTARNLAQIGGEVRDHDVLCLDIVSSLQGVTPKAIALEPLATLLAARASTKRVALRTELSQSAVNDFLFNLADFIESRGWRDPSDKGQKAILSQPVEILASMALDKQWKRVSRFGARLDELTVPERHEMRKALKKMRYGTEFFGPLFPKQSVKPFLKRMQRLQDIFGYLNDVAMAEKLLHLKDVSPKEAHQCAAAIGFVIGWHEATCASQWPSARRFWLDTQTIPRFWRSS
ncbi:CYTH and CHAD domain-containing protein [Roseibium sediminis]|uniref:CYTH and CHAD domain-containing protein n=1 Tax=Roseibium sediminis TaxID=1775174 RepID=UPI00123D805E|nr:CYTH and CHAD domain-containing protein [Roseibium sediminis]